MLISDFKLLEQRLKPSEIHNLYHFRPLEAFSIDSRTIRKHQGFIAIKGKYQDGHKFIPQAIKKGAGLIIAQKYIPTSFKIPFFVVEDTYKALGTLAGYIRQKKNPFVYAITGSVGKTTTKEMLFFLLKEHYKVLKNQGTENNFLGVAKTILSLTDEKVAILELGTNAKGEIAALAEICLPDAGIITYVKPVHLEGLADLRGVWQEKVSMFKATPRIRPVLNRDDSYLAKTKVSQKVFWFGRSRNNDLFARLKGKTKENAIFLIQNKHELVLPLHQEGFITNALAAISGARLLGIELGGLVEKMNQFKELLPMRMQMQPWGEHFVLNDAYNANPYSFAQALKVLKNYPLRKIAVIGDMLELGRRSRYYHQLLALQIMRNNFDYCLTIGSFTLCLREKLHQLGYKRAYHFLSHKEIAEFIARRTHSRRYLIFLKGSRKMELEKVINHLS